MCLLMSEFEPVSQPSSASDADEIVILEEGIGIAMGKISGLYVGGIVQERRRRYINRENNERIEIVTYTIADDNDKKYYVEDYAPSSPFFSECCPPTD